MNLEKMLVREADIKRYTYCMIDIQNRQTRQDRKHISSFQALGMGMMGNKCPMGGGFYFVDNVNVLELGSGDGGTAL